MDKEFNKSSSVDFKDYFSHDSENYLKFRPKYPQELFDFINAKVQNHNLAIDFGCGSGQATIEVAKFFQKVIGVDASSQQIKQALKLPNIDYVVSTFDQFEYLKNSCDLITCVNAVHWFDIEKFMNISKSILKHNGLCAVWCYSLFQIESDIYNIFLEIFKDLESYWPKERQIVENKYRSIYFPFREIEHPEFVIYQKWNYEQIIGHIKTWSSYNNYIKSDKNCPIEARINMFNKYRVDQVFDVNFAINLRIGFNN